MRLLYLNHNVRGSGTYWRAFQLGRALFARGHEVTLVTTSMSARWTVHTVRSDGVEVVEAPDLLWGRGRTGWDPWNGWRRVHALRGRGFEVIHAFDSRPAVVHPALQVQRRTGAALFMDWADWWGRGGWIEERSGWAVRTLFGPIETWYEEHFRTSAAGTTTISSALAQRAITLGVPAERILCLPNGCDLLGIVPRSSEPARERLRLARNIPVLLHVGVLTQGDHRFLMRAFARVQSAIPRAVLVLAGRTAIQIGNARGVIVTGALGWAELLDWIAAADVCVVPSRDTIGNRGRWPSKVNDYLAGGKAVVMPRVGDVGELIHESGAGWSTRADEQDFADNMILALEDEQARTSAGERARKLAEVSLAWPLLAERLQTFYEAVLAQPSLRAVPSRADTRRPGR